jgi:hypothetical protein
MKPNEKPANVAARLAKSHDKKLLAGEVRVTVWLKKDAAKVLKKEVAKGATVRDVISEALIEKGSRK